MGLVDTSFESCPPRADSMINSLRAFGYNLGKAIADIIDNSIFANANKILIRYDWNDGDPWISILDNGIGMSEVELKESMRLGSTNPNDKRHEDDLGRFGLGLKTASFSQCKLLLVVSKTETGEVASRFWNLDHVQATREWNLGKTVPSNLKPVVDEIDLFSSGTMIVWSNLDRVVDISNDDNELKDAFFKRFIAVKEYLEMVFHRFLSEKNSRIEIYVGKHRCKPWDPFMRNNIFTQELSHEHFRNKSISVVPYVLPHLSKRSIDENMTGRGIKGWNAQQGFYVYRNKRMIVSGGYLDLDIVAEDHYKLARIRVDITNEMDHDWKIDVRKAIASPPDDVRSDLLRIAKATRTEAMKIYRARTGRSSRVSPIGLSSDIWQRRRIGEKIIYKINKHSLALKRIIEEQNPPKDWIKKLFSTIESTIPHKLIIIDNAETEDCHVGLPPESNHPLEGLLNLCELFYRDAIEQGKKHEEAIDWVIGIEPFNTHHLYRMRLEEKKKGENKNG